MVNNHGRYHRARRVDPGGSAGVSTMKASLRILISAIAVGLPASAFAADYEPPIVVDQPVEEVPVEVGSGWYLRGDIGYNFDLQGRGDFEFRAFDPVAGVSSADVF